MQKETRLSKALADGAELLVQSMVECQSSVRICIEHVWTERDRIVDGRSTNILQAQQFLGLSGELAAQLAKLKDQTSRQHIAVERIETIRTPEPDDDGFIEPPGPMTEGGGVADPDKQLVVEGTTA